VTQQNESPEAGRQSVSVGQAYGRLKRSIDNLDSDTCLSPPFAYFLAGGQASQTCYLALLAPSPDSSVGEYSGHLRGIKLGDFSRASVDDLSDTLASETPSPAAQSPARMFGATPWLLPGARR